MRAQSVTQYSDHSCMAGRSVARLCATVVACILISCCAAFLPGSATTAGSCSPLEGVVRRPHAGELNRARKGPVLFARFIATKTKQSMTQHRELDCFVAPSGLLEMTRDYQHSIPSLNSDRGLWP